MKRISAGGAGGVRVRERGAGSGALSALPRLQLELTAFTRHTVCSVTPPPPELHAEGMGQGEDRPHHRRRAAQHGLMVFKIKLSEAKANDGEREEW
jgi:hypothetical protein